MGEGFYVVLSIVLGIALYVLIKVFYYIRRSREQWLEVDKSKLREWKDDEDW